MTAQRLIGIVVVLTLVFLHAKEARAQMPPAMRFLSHERYDQMITVSGRNVRLAEQDERPNYPRLLSGWRINFDSMWLGAVFDHPLLYFLKTAAVESMRNYSESRAGMVDGKKVAVISASDVGKDYLRRILLEPLNARYMPENMSLIFDVKTGGGNVGVVLGLKYRF